MGPRIISCGIIAGLSMAETLRSAPGVIMDLYNARLRYDAALQGRKLEED